MFVGGGSILELHTFQEQKVDSDDCRIGVHLDWDAVTRRFGGKYAKKVLVSAKKLGDVYLERANEMGIEIRWVCFVLKCYE